MPDARYGEEVCAWIVPCPGAAPGEDEIREHCRGQIAHYKVPRHVRVVSELPMTVAGKPQEFIMRDKMIAELGQAEVETA